MPEEYTLTTPTTVPPVVNAKWKVVALGFEWTAGQITVRLTGENGEGLSTGYGGPMATEAERHEAIKLMRTLNTANLTTKSLHKRVMEKLAADGKLPAGSVTGTPDPIA